MDKFSDIIATRNENPKTPVPQYIIDVRDTTDAPTDERYVNAAIEALGGDKALPWWITEGGVEYSNEPIVPTLPMIFKYLGITDDDEKKKNPRSAARKFVEDWKYKKDDWEKKVKKNPALGEHGWKTVEQMHKRAIQDLAQEDLKKARHDVIHDGTFSGFLTRLMFPRMTERLENTGDWQPQDLALDLGNVGLMSIPGSSFVKLGGAAARRVAPSLVLKAKNAAEALRASNSTIAASLPWMGEAAANTLGNTMVPLASEVLDDIVYDPGEGMDDRANFSMGDVVLGGAINQAVNRGLIQYLAPYIDKYSGSLTRVGAQKLRELLSTLGKSRSELGKNFVNNIRLRTSTPVVRVAEEGTQITPNELAALQNGKNIIPEGMSIDEFIDNYDIAKVIDMIDNGTITFKSADDIANMGAERAARARTHLYNEAQDLKADAVQHLWDTGDLAGSTDVQRFAAQLEDLAASGKQVSGLTPSDILNGLKFTGDLPTGSAMSKETVSDIFMKNPELFNYAYWAKAPFGAKVENAVHQAWPSLVVNEAGRSNFAREVASQVEDEQKQNREESKRQAKQIGVSEVLKSDGLSDEDKKWLGMIATNPDIITVGLDDPKENDKFKMWLLMGGNDLLRGTEAHRPLWKVE